MNQAADDKFLFVNIIDNKNEPVVAFVYTHRRKYKGFIVNIDLLEKQRIFLYPNVMEAKVRYLTIDESYCLNINTLPLQELQIEERSVGKRMAFFLWMN